MNSSAIRSPITSTCRCEKFSTSASSRARSSAVNGGKGTDGEVGIGSRMRVLREPYEDPACRFNKIVDHRIGGDPCRRTLLFVSAVTGPYQDSSSPDGPRQ